jgi:hypothetical protein
MGVGDWLGGRQSLFAVVSLSSGFVDAFVGAACAWEEGPRYL